MPSFSRFLVAGLILLSTVPAFAIEDTPQNRLVEAERYVKVSQVETLMGDVAKSMAQTMPESQRAMFIALMTKHLDMVRVTAAIKQAMVQTFTADELHALADFQGSPVGKAAMAKMGNYMSALMPAIMQETQAAVLRAQAEALQQQNQQPR